MASKVIHTGDLSALPLLTDILAAVDGRQLLEETLLANLSTSGSGAVSNVSEISYLIYEIVQYALFINSQDYDIDAAAKALLDAQGT